LNIHLVRMGGCSADTMFLNKGDIAHVTKEKYESFINKILEAESLPGKSVSAFGVSRTSRLKGIKRNFAYIAIQYVSLILHPDLFCDAN
jgi:hypothetical protein